MKQYWGRSLDLYFSICVGAEEVGRNFDDCHTEEAMEKQDDLFEALTGLHARACRVAVEVHHLLAGGFPMGALARCRTLHEIAVTMMVLADFGEMEEHSDLAERFLLHDDIDNWTDAKIHQEHYEALGSEAFTADQMAEMEQRRAELLGRFGESYRYSYGWAVGLDGLKKPDFPDLESLAKVPHLRGRYRWASHEIHAGSKGWRLNVSSMMTCCTRRPGQCTLVLPSQAAWRSRLYVSAWPLFFPVLTGCRHKTCWRLR